MPSRQAWITHTFGGGWATDFGASYFAPPDQGGRVVIPFLTDARNTVFEFDGGLRKAPGTNRLNATSVSAGGSDDILGVFDYWRMGTANTPVQRRILHVGTAIMEDGGNGVFANLFTGLENTVVPQYSTFDDLLLIGSTSTTDVPRSWDGTTAQNLAGSPPRFSFSVPHKNRQWAAGVWTTGSRVYYSENLDPENWTAAGSGSIDIDPNDGDVIVGIASHKNDLWVFKGPYNGSIHRITGSAPTGSDAFARTTFIRGIPAAWINSIFRFGDDLGFVSSRGSVHSLAATAAFGDFNQAYLSYPIGRYLREDIAQNRHRTWWAATDTTNGQVWLSLSPSGQTTNTRSLIMDYRFLAQGERFPRWSYWDSRAFGSLASVIDTNNRPRLMAGAYDGFVYRLQQATRDDTGTAITHRSTSPYLSYGDIQRLKNIYSVGLTLVPRNDNNITFGWQRDSNTQQTQTITQGGGGFLLDTSILGTGILGAAGQFTPRFAELETGGEFRTIQYDFQEAAASSDFEIHGFVTALEPSSISTEN